MKVGKKITFIKITYCMIFFWFFNPSVGFALQDTQAPVLIDTYSLSTSSINTESSSATVSVTFQATDDLSGVCAIGDVCTGKTAVFFSSYGDQSQAADVERISGDKNDGTYRANVNFPQYAESGLWDMDICIIDHVGNRSCNDYEYESVITNVAAEDDQSSPHVVGIPNVTPLSINTDTGNIEIDVTLEITDDRSGVCIDCSDQTYLYLEGQRGALERVSGDDKNGVYSGTIIISQYRSFSGSQELEINVSDHVGNDNEYSFNYTFENTGVNLDITQPAVGSPSVTPNTADVSDEAWTITVTLDATDNLSGVCESSETDCVSQMVLLMPNGLEMKADVTRVSGDALSGTYQSIFALPRYAREGYYDLCYLVSDHANNKNDLCDSTVVENVLFVSAITPVLGEVSPVPTPTNDNTPDYTFSTSEEGTITYGGDCFSTTTDATVGDNTITFNTLADGAYSNCTITVTDISGNVSNILAVNTFEVNVSPVLEQSTPVSTPTNDNTPEYTFNSTEAGTITYGGDCSSVTTDATVGENTITFNALADGTYSNCTITVTDAGNNASNILSINTFVVDVTPPTLTQITPVLSPTNDNTPAYTYHSNEAGIVVFGGSCGGSGDLIPPPMMISSGDQTYSFPALADGEHGDCTVRITDAAHNSSILTVDSFVIDTIAPTLAEITAVPSLTNDNTPDYTFNSTEAGTISYGGDCTSVTADATVGENMITFNALTDGTYDNCYIAVEDTANNRSAGLHMTSFSVETGAPYVDFYRYEPEDEITNARSAIIEIDFSEPVKNVTIDDFIQSGTAASAIAQIGGPNTIEKINDEEYLFHIPQTFDGTYYLVLHHDNDILDLNDNPVVQDVDPDDERYDFRIPPTISIDGMTKKADSEILESIIIFDEKQISKDAIQIDSSLDGAVKYADLNCVQTNIDRIDCTVKILSSGELVIRAKDAANNESVKSEKEYMIGNIEPEEQKVTNIPKPDFSFSGKLKNAVLSSKKKLYIEDDEVKFKGEYPEIAGGIVVIKYKRGSDSEEETVDVDQQGSWSKRIGFDKDGSYQIKFTFFDKDGKEIGEKGYYKIKIDTEDPQIADMPAKLTKRPGDKIWWSASDNEEIDEYKYYFNGKKEKTDDPFFFVPQGTAAGTYVLEIRAYDKAGNKDVKYVTIVVR